jgi:uncharacterized membrane protein YkvA (DUF1232 family)
MIVSLAERRWWTFRTSAARCRGRRGALSSVSAVGGPRTEPPRIVSYPLAGIAAAPHAAMMERTRIKRLKEWARAIKLDVVALWLAARDPGVKWLVKAAAAAVAAYALSPIDLIPDFIPILGYLDDLLIVPLGIMLVVRLIPHLIMADLRAKAGEQGKLTSMAGLVAVLTVWSVAIAVVAWLVWTR